jgi:hypothetical protein
MKIFLAFTIIAMYFLIYGFLNGSIMAFIHTYISILKELPVWGLALVLAFKAMLFGALIAYTDGDFSFPVHIVNNKD